MKHLGRMLIVSCWAAVGILATETTLAAEKTLRQPRGDLVGQIETYTTVYEDTLIDLARRFDVGFVALLAANPGVDPWVPGHAASITIPAAYVLPDVPRQGIVVNMSEQRLYYFAADRKVIAFPIGTSRPGWNTPLIATRVIDKREKPTWIPTPAIRADDPDLPAAVPPGPHNPLGDYALYLALPTYVIHGTNRPEGVGRRVSRGCIRLYPEDIAWLYPRVTIGMPVTLIDEPMKLGWSDSELYLEVHPDPDQALELEETGRFTPAVPPGFRSRIEIAAGVHANRLDWPIIVKAVEERRGIPLRITRPNTAAARP
jgi:L,D-transpeptidase ErfK/SrfK